MNSILMNKYLLLGLFNNSSTEANVEAKYVISFVCVCRYVVNLSLPSATLREELWRRLLPKRAPLSSDINYVVLSERSVARHLTGGGLLDICLFVCFRFPFNGGQIATCICQAAELCASATPPIITHDSLSVAAEFEVKRKQNQAFLSSLFS